ncbi:MAG: universal stress protein [Sporomusaceae bacterium]|nr:universal stress protein [Sporomusaceae bacterium]
MEILYKKILVPIDGSIHSRKALSHAVALARSFAAKIGILYVSVLSQQVPLYNQIKGTKIPPNASTDPVTFAKAILAESIKQVPEDILVQAHNEIGEPRLLITDFAAQHDYDVIVIGSRGLGTISGLLLGSVSTYVVHHSPCPVLIIK